MQSLNLTCPPNHSLAVPHSFPFPNKNIKVGPQSVLGCPLKFINTWVLQKEIMKTIYEIVVL